MKFGALGRAPRLPSRVAAVIAQEVVEGRLRPGDRLPAEQSLADRFGVSRNVVREAIARLRSDGVLEARQGVGIFVASNEATAMLRIDAELMNDRLVFRNVFELRAILEIRAAGLAAARADDEHDRAISAALNGMRTARNWAEDGVSADLEFHRAVARATRNPYIATVVGFLAGQMRQSIMFMRQNQRDADGSLTALNVAEHAAIRDAILARSAKAAREAMGRHISNAARRLGYELEDGVGLPDDAAGS